MGQDEPMSVPLRPMLSSCWRIFNHLGAILGPYTKNCAKLKISINSSLFCAFPGSTPGARNPGAQVLVASPNTWREKDGKQRLFVCSCCECWAMCEETLLIWGHAGYASEAMLGPCCMTCRHSYVFMGMLAAAWDHLCFCMQRHS